MMCTPTAALAMTAVSTVGSMYAAQQQASAMQGQYNYQAQIAENNAKMAQAQAESNAVAGAQQAKLTYQKSQTVKAAQEAAYSANGLDIGQGSPLDILSDTEKLGQLDKANVLYNTANNTWAIQNQKQDYLNQANLDRTAAYNAGVMGGNNMFSSLLTGASALAGQYNQFNYSGALNKKPATVPQYGMGGLKALDRY